MELVPPRNSLVDTLAEALRTLGGSREELLEKLPDVFQEVAGRPLDKGDDYDIVIANAALRLVIPDE